MPLHIYPARRRTGRSLGGGEGAAKKFHLSRRFMSSEERRSLSVSRRTATGVPAVVKRGGRLLLLVLVAHWSAGGGSGTAARAQSPSEHQVEAAFLYNFAKFVEWPSQVFNDPGDPLVLCVMGEDPFGKVLDAIVLGKTANGHPLAVRRLKRQRDAGGCQILFFGASERNRLRAVLRNLERPGTLTVGETEGFARQGGMINFILEDNRVHFEINPEAADRAGLKISSKLLSLAKIVREER